jgi:hypothetical protein
MDVVVGVNGLGVPRSDVLKLREVSEGHESNEERSLAYLNVGLVVMLLVEDVMILAEL